MLVNFAWKVRALLNLSPFETLVVNVSEESAFIVPNQGEPLVLFDDGTPTFQALRNWQRQLCLSHPCPPTKEELETLLAESYQLHLRFMGLQLQMELSPSRNLDCDLDLIRLELDSVNQTLFRKISFATGVSLRYLSREKERWDSLKSTRVYYPILTELLLNHWDSSLLPAFNSAAKNATGASSKTSSKSTSASSFTLNSCLFKFPTQTTTPSSSPPIHKRVRQLRSRPKFASSTSAMINKFVGLLEFKLDLNKP